MNEWLYDLPLGWLTLVIFVITYLLTWIIYAVVMSLAVGERIKAFMSISGGMLPPLGVVYGLFVTVIASQVWGDVDKANTAVNREASALSTITFLASSFPGETEIQIRKLVNRHIEEAINHEWPMMARHTASLNVTSQPLAEALQLILAITPRSEGQATAQRQIADALGDAFDARRQRIIVSQSSVNWIKWGCLILQAICTLLAIAMIHSGNRLAAINAMLIFATGVAVSVLLIISHNRPFGGAVSVGPDLLAQVGPEEMISQRETSHTVALHLTTLLHSARAVISDYQDLINEQKAGKNFTAEKVIEEAKRNYARITGRPLPDLDKNSAEGLMLLAELDAIKEVMDQAQPLINNPDLGFKGFLPAIFAYRVADVFKQKVGNLAYLKLTAPEELIRLKSNMPDVWENTVIKNKFQSVDWKKGQYVAEEAELNGKKAYRLMIPEYYEASCLQACHGKANDKPDSGGKLGDLGGAISAAIYLK